MNGERNRRRLSGGGVPLDAVKDAQVRAVLMRLNESVVTLERRVAVLERRLAVAERRAQTH
jgi:hypothetical protein